MKSPKGFFAATAGFIKKHIYLILLFLCVAAIVTVIVVATTANKSTTPPPTGNEDPLPDPDPDPVVTGPMEFSLPVKEGTLGNGFSLTEFVKDVTRGGPNGSWCIHKAIDFKAPAGTNVHAVYDGTVEEIYTDYYEGTVVVISHQDNVKTIYKSLDETVSVRVGDTVKTNDVIGKVSASMQNEVGEGPHLHFEVWKGNAIIDPYIYLLDIPK